VIGTCASVEVLAGSRRTHVWAQLANASEQDLDHRLAILKFQQTVIVAEVNVVVARRCQAQIAPRNSSLREYFSELILAEVRSCVPTLPVCQRDDIDLIPVGLQQRQRTVRQLIIIRRGRRLA